MSAAITISAVGSAASAYSANQASKQAGRAMDAQQRSQQEDLAFRRQQYDRYLGLMGPIEERLAGEANSSQPLDYTRNAAAIKQNFADTQRSISGAMGLRGMAGGGLDAGAIRGAAFQQAGGAQ